MSFLPGWHPDMGGGPPLLAFRASAKVDAETIDIPATAQAGDLAILVQGSTTSGSGAPTNVFPSGWQDIPDWANVLGGQDWRFTSGFKILTADDIGATLTGMNTGNVDDKILLVFSGGFTTAALREAVKDAVNGDPAAASVSASAATTTCLVVAGVSTNSGSTSTITDQTPSLAATVVQGGLEFGYNIYQIYEDASDQSIDKADDGGRNGTYAAYWELT